VDDRSLTFSVKKHGQRLRADEIAKLHCELASLGPIGARRLQTEPRKDRQFAFTNFLRYPEKNSELFEIGLCEFVQHLRVKVHCRKRSLRTAAARGHEAMPQGPRSPAQRSRH
jgi:hypothetical protein